MEKIGLSFSYHHGKVARKVDVTITPSRRPESPVSVEASEDKASLHIHLPRRFYDVAQKGVQMVAAGNLRDITVLVERIQAMYTLLYGYKKE